MAQLKEVKLHDLGEGLDGGKLIEWHIDTNDVVDEGDIIASVETAKAIVELPTPFSGKINHINIPVDSVVHTGATIATIAVENNKTTQNDLPLVGKPIHESNTLLNEASMRAKQTESNETLLPTNLMIKNMMLAKQVVAATLFDDMKIDNFTADKNLTAQIIIKIIHALKENPKLNAHFNHISHQLEVFEDINLGIAFNDKDHLLKVPVISQIQKNDHTEIEAAISSIKIDGMNSKYIDHKIPSPTFTLTNIGSIGGKYGTPVLIPPGVAILAIGRKEKRPVVVDSKIEIGTYLPISLTFDHRILTGAQATKFIQDLCI